MIKERIVQITLARKSHSCEECPAPIARGELYYSLYWPGAGLGSNKFPDRVHIDCLLNYMEKEG